MKRKNNYKRMLPYVWLAIAAFIALGVYFNHGYPDGHDLEYHAATVVGMSRHGFIDIFTGKIFGCVSNDLGYGEGFFYPPFAHIGAAVIYKMIGGFASVFTALKIFYFLVLFFSGVFMYRFISLTTKNQKAAVFAGVLYVTTPYFLTDVLVRSAMAESTMFLFMPITLIGFYYLIRDNYKRFLVYFVVGCVGSVHSHLVLTMYFVLLSIVGFLPKIKTFFQGKRFWYLLLGVVVTVLLSLPFLVPMLQAKNGGEYMAFQPSFMAKVENTQGFRVPFDYLISINKVLNNVPLYLNFFSIFILLYALFNYRKIKTEENDIFVFYAMALAIVGIFCSTTLFSWEHAPYFLLLIQFSWRLLSFAGLGLAILAGFCILKLDKNGMLLYVVIVLSCLFSIAQINNYIHADNVSQEDLPITSSYIVDYVPVEITEQQIKEHNHDIVASDEGVVFSDVESNVPDLQFKIDGVDGSTEIILPRYYYVGYSIKVKGKDDGDFRQVDYYNKDGFIAFVAEADAEVRVNYPGTTEQQLSYGIAGVTAVGCLTWVGIAKWKRRKIE